MPLFRDAWRALGAAPVVSVAAVLSLALGIGATTAMFSIVDALLLRSLPVRDPRQLVQVTAGGNQTALTNPIWEQFRDRQSAVFDGAVAWGTTRFDLAQGGETDPVNGLFTSGSFFDVLGVGAERGRLYSADDDRRGGGPHGAVAVISHAFWQRRFGGAEDIIGRPILLQRTSFTIIGVTARSFSGPDVGRAFDVAAPLGTEPLVRARDSSLDRRSNWFLTVLARLRPGQTIEEAATAMQSLIPAVREATLPTDWRPEELKHYLAQPFELLPAASGTSFLRARYERPLETLMVVVSLVLLVACANIANLLLARAGARRREFSVRIALGASRWRLARQLFAESLLLAAAGAAAGLVVAEWGSALLVRQLSSQVTTVYLDAGVDLRMLLFTGAVAVVTALVFGTAPAWRAGRVSAGEVLVSQPRGASESSQRLAGGLVVAQVALSLVLVNGATLFLRTFATLATQDLGMTRSGVLIANLNAQRSGVALDARIGHFERLRRELTAVPGVTAAATSAVTPISGSSSQFRVDVPGRPDVPPAQRGVFANEVSPDWFRVYGIPLVSGRDFVEGDARGAPDVAIINRTLASRLFGASSPLNQVLELPGRPGTPTRSLIIVGVVGDASYRSLRDPVPPTLYTPVAQARNPASSTSLSVKSDLAAAGLSRSLASVIGRVDRDISVTFRALEDQIDAALVQERLLAILSAFFGVLAVVLAGLGLYGVTAYTVSRRRVEMGIRLALGSTPGGVIRLVFSRVAVLVGLGVAFGAVASYWAASYVTTLTFGVEARDLPTLGAAGVVLALTGAAAAWLPARRAARLSPAKVLHEG